MSTNNDNLGRIASALERIAAAFEGGAVPRPAAQQTGTSSGGGQRSNTPRSGLPTHFPNYGRSKGEPIKGASQGDLEFYANGARRSLADPTKSRFYDKEQALLDAIEAELAKPSGRGEASDQGVPADDWRGPPPGGPSDEDIPF